jgi:hypothetical protein
MRGGDPRLELLVPQLPLGRRAGAMLVVGRRGDRGTQLAELRADRLDTPSQTKTVSVGLPFTDMAVDERDDQ